MKTFERLFIKAQMWLRVSWLGVLFTSLYVLISVATFRHSAYGFASLENASFAWGALSALAVDAGMALSAAGLRKERNLWLVVGLGVAAVASTYTQLLFAVTHAEPMVVAEGARWLTQASFLIDARVLVLPCLLPALSLVYAASGKGRDTQGQLIDLTQQVMNLQEIARQAQGEKDMAFRQRDRAVESVGAWQDLGKAKQAAIMAYFDPELTNAQVAGLIECHPETVKRGKREEVIGKGGSND